MPQRLFVIAVTGTPKALDALEQRIDAAVEAATQAGGITALTTEALLGVPATKAADALRNAAAGRSRAAK